MLQDDMLLKRFVLVPAGMLLLLIFVLSGIGYLLFSQKVEAEEKNSQLRTSASNLVQEVRFLRMQEELYLQYGDKYKEILNTGLVKGFDRIKWLDELIEIKKDLVAVPFLIQFEPERKMEQEHFPSYLFTRDIFYYIRMNIESSLQTDHDLVALNRMISERISPLFSIEACEVRVDKGMLDNIVFNPQQGNFNTRCSFIIFQAKPRRLNDD